MLNYHELRSKHQKDRQFLADACITEKGYEAAGVVGICFLLAAVVLLASCLFPKLSHAYNNGGSYEDVQEKRMTPVGSQYKAEEWDGQVDRAVLTVADAMSDPQVLVSKGPDREHLSVIEKDARIRALTAKVIAMKRELKAKDMDGVYVKMSEE